MTLLLASLVILALGGAAAFAFGGDVRRASAIGAGTAVAACVIGLVPAVRALAHDPTGPFLFPWDSTLRLPWSVPGASFYVALDPLSAFFLIPVFVLAALAAVYGAGYLRVQSPQSPVSSPDGGPTTEDRGPGTGDGGHREAARVRACWFHFNVTVAAMVLLIVARNGVLFLAAWEAMTLASYFLVVFEHEKAESRSAGWVYLVASHLGAACLLALFVLLGGGADTLDFDRFAPPGPGARVTADVLFVLAVVGFGVKAGFVPLHIWLPEAHPAAPSHVSALMSGVLIKTGIYGLLRTLTFLGPPPLWWGWLLTAIGVTSGVLGVLFALAQHDLKRLLAYHSIENIGIIALGIGTGLVGLSAGCAPLAVLGFAGGLLHVVNHALFKGLLFLGAGAVAHATGTRDMDRLGGLLKRMPWTGAAFLAGSAAITGLPPLNGFVSEFLIFFGAYRGGAVLGAAGALPAFAAIGGLALIGGLAAACFAKAFGTVFLGEPREEAAAHAHEAGPAMLAPMLLLAAACVAIGLAAPAAASALEPVVAQAAGLPRAAVRGPLADAGFALASVTAGALAFLLALAALAILRRRLLAGRAVAEAGTWDCGYARPTARMQYTASSFAQPLTDLFAPVLRTRRHAHPPAGLFPRDASLATETPDPLMDVLWRPLSRRALQTMAKGRWLQHGRVQIYVLYIALCLMVLVLWKLR